MADTEDLPRAHVKRIVKNKLQELQAKTDGEEKKREIQVQKEALQALSESAKIFIHYLTATANDLCHESKRSTISADDVMRAIEETEFSEFLEPLKAHLEGYKKEHAEKSQKRLEKRVDLKRKAAELEAGAPAVGADNEGGGEEADTG
eukprot:CAMPEP_0198212350 /NCGR_PEP_ID=MMETSP1445-20131203/25693_1 /TAXON_ID=36898 /ORGANISM="Pyramimonas sp., Strain CCMP2087" /LENGTH=147 /DNA_ID=CAMNT_0043886773 /DNA_START=312 /DNA_END=751 /DNA_ORIENTATION=-